MTGLEHLAKWFKNGPKGNCSQVRDAVLGHIGRERTAIRLSPGAYYCIDGNEQDKAVFDYLLNEIEKRDIAFVHHGMRI